MDAALLLLGFVCAGLGGDFFVRGAVGAARWARVPAGIVAATVAAFGTSAPELAVTIAAASEGTPEIAFGNALGANVANLGLILGAALAIAPIRATREELRRDVAVAFLAPALLGLFVLDGALSRIDGALTVGLFVVWLGATIVEARRQRSAAPHVLGEKSRGASAVLLLIGLALLVAAGELVVDGAQGVGAALGISPFVVGAIIAAFGTTLPELATMLAARLRGHDEVGIETALGSVIFNGLFIVGVAALIHPFAVAGQAAAISLTLGAILAASVYPLRSGVIRRRRGALLLAIYVVHAGLLLQIRG